MCRTTVFDSIALFIEDTNETHRVSPVLDTLQIASTHSKKISARYDTAKSAQHMTATVREAKCEQ